MIALILRILLSWASLAFRIDPRNPLVVLLHDITEPILAPLRQIIPSLGGFDFSPLVAIILLELIAQAASRALL